MKFLKMIISLCGLGLSVYSLFLMGRLWIESLFNDIVLLFQSREILWFEISYFVILFVLIAIGMVLTNMYQEKTIDIMRKEKQSFMTIVFQDSITYAGLASLVSSFFFAVIGFFSLYFRYG